jgi:hypothetical protein
MNSVPAFKAWRPFSKKLAIQTFLARGSPNAHRKSHPCSLRRELEGLVTTI